MKKSATKNDQESFPLPPGGGKKVLLHVCCAVCSGAIIEAMREAGADVTLYFYNPNIHPAGEYERRKTEAMRHAVKRDIPCVDADYDWNRWMEITRGHEDDPEKGPRCSLCFEMRLLKTAEYAYGHGFGIFSSTLGISRWKNFEQVSQAGQKAASLFPGLQYWACNWRKKNGSQRMAEIAKQENFYRQEYCGCRYSLRDANLARKNRGLPPLDPEGVTIPAAHPGIPDDSPS